MSDGQPSPDQETPPMLGEGGGASGEVPQSSAMPSGVTTPARTSLAVGVMLPGTPYRVMRLLGAGGMGEVYEAEHELLGAKRALKVLAPHTAERPGIAERLKLEARALAKLQHPNLVEVIDLGISEGRWYFAMQLLEGRTLRDAQRGQMPWEQATRIVVALLDGLHAAHDLGLVHRDVKPENAFVCDDGTVKLLDFGIAKIASLDALTKSGHTIGTPRYMAPEQIEGKAVDRRTDVYSAGVVLFELLAKRAPFEDTDGMALAYAHVHRPAPALPAAAAAASGGRLAKAVARALEKSPEARFASADDFARELRACLTDAGLTVNPPPVPKRLASGELDTLKRSLSADASAAERAQTDSSEGERASMGGVARSAPTETLTSDAILTPAKTSEPVALRLPRMKRAGIVAWAAALLALFVLLVSAVRLRARDKTMSANASDGSGAAAVGKEPEARPIASASAGEANANAPANATAATATTALAPAPSIAAPAPRVRKSSTIPRGPRAGNASDAGPAPRRDDDSLILE